LKKKKQGKSDWWWWPWTCSKYMNEDISHSHFLSQQILLLFLLIYTFVIYSSYILIFVIYYC
jgi:hypothetical protein